mgnify:CR=1 FL=1
MPHHGRIQECIQHCRSVINDLHSLAQNVGDPQTADMLREGAHHLSLCLQECDFVAGRIQHLQHQPQFAGRPY